MAPSTLYDSLHPLEINILAIFTQSSTPLTDPQLAQEAQLEASQVSMAIGWLLAKELIRVKTETRTLFVTLTEVGRSYLDEVSPPEWILRRITDNQDERLTVQDLQAQGIFQPTELSRAIGLLKKEQAIRLVSGGVVESTNTPSATTQAIRELLQHIHSATLELASFSTSHQTILRQFSVKRGNSHEPFRIEEHVAREYELTASGQEIGQLCHRGRSEERRGGKECRSRWSPYH